MHNSFVENTMVQCESDLEMHPNTKQVEDLKCGEILLSMKENEIHFICGFCDYDFYSLNEFLSHTLQHHLSIDSVELSKILQKVNNTRVNDELNRSCQRSNNIIRAAIEHEESNDDLVDSSNYLIEILDGNEGSDEENNFITTAQKDEVQLQTLKNIGNKNIETEYSIQFEVLKNNWFEEDEPISFGDVDNDAVDEAVIVENKASSPQLKTANSTNSGDFKIEFISNDMYDVNEKYGVDKVKLSRNTNINQAQSTLGKCKICQKIFNNKKLLKTHLRRHSRLKSYVCEFCDAGFAEKSNLKVHRYRHLGIKPHACSLCEKAFTSSTELKLHVRSHTGERPYVCAECGQTFTNSAHLTAHLRRHTNERPYICQLCQKSFYDSKILRDHEASHSKERPYACDVCVMSFTRRKALVEHTKLHSGVKKYCCQICHKDFAQNSGLHSHMRKQHALKL